MTPTCTSAISLRPSWRMARIATAFCLLVAGCSPATPSIESTTQPLVAPSTPSPATTIRISGSPENRALLDALQQGFQATHPEVAFTQSLHGPESTLAGVYTGTADIAFMGRELREPMERMAFEWVLLDKPLSVDIAEANIVTDRQSSQIGVFVHKDNPLRQLSLRQLDAIYGAEHRRGESNIRRWGELGLDGDWAGRAIIVHGPAVDSVQALHLRRVVLKDSRKWNPDYRQTASEGAAVIAAVAQDRDGIGYAPLRDATPDVKAIALAASDDGAYFQADAASVQSRQYPLARSISVVTAQTRDKPMPAMVRTFVTYLLSDEGQAIIARDGGYLPLAADTRKTQQERLP